MPEPLSPTDYVAAGGNLCPACGAEDTALMYADLDVRGYAVRQYVTCCRCEASWQDWYELTRYNDLLIPEKETK